MPKSRRGRGEGGIYREASTGRWVASVTLGYHDGRQVRRVERYATAREAQAGMLRLQTLRAADRPLCVERVTVGEYLSRWLTEWVEPRCAPKTHLAYEAQVCNHIAPALGHIPLPRLTAAHVDGMMLACERRGLSGASRAQIFAVVRSAMRRAAHKRLIESDPTDRADRPVIEQREMRYWTADQARQFLAGIAGDPFYPLFVLALTTGMRQGELLGLRWQDVDLAAGVLRVVQQAIEIRGEISFTAPKSKAGCRGLTLPAIAIEALCVQRRLQRATGLAFLQLVFTYPDGGPLRKNRVQGALKRMIRKTGVPLIRFHDLRHSAATILLGQGESLKVVQARLGHSKLAVTADRYAHVTQEMQQVAAARLDQVFAR